MLCYKKSIPSEMISFASRILGNVRWSRGDVVCFLGEFLTQPKPHVVFHSRRSRGTRMRLDEKSQLLYSGSDFFLNGDTVAVPARARTAMRAFAERREINVTRLAALAGLIGQWRRAGYVHLEQRNG